MKTAELLRSPVLKNICEQLPLSDIIFDTISLKQFGFRTTYSFKILASERKIKLAMKAVFHYKIYSDELTFFSLRKVLLE